MTNVIAFSTEGSRFRPLRREAGAEILFFTGVRYVRDADIDRVPVAAEAAVPVRKDRMKPETHLQDAPGRLLA